MKQNKKILITGVNGFLGRALWRYLKKQNTGFQIYGLSRTDDGCDSGIFVCDLTAKDKLKAVLVSMRPDFIFHMAGGRMIDKKILFRSNYETTQCLLDVIQEIDIRPRVIIPGSAAEYGRMCRTRRKVKETDTAMPVTAYGIAKFKQTKLGLDYARKGGDVVIARIFNVMGEGTPSTLAIGRFAEQIVRIEQGLQEKVMDTKNLESKRDFLDIKDICAGLWAVARDGSSGEIYNVCSGHPLEMGKALRGLLLLSRIKNVIIRKSKDSHSPSFDVIGSNMKLRSVSGWFPEVSLERSLKGTLDSHRARR